MKNFWEGARCSRSSATKHSSRVFSKNFLQRLPRVQSPPTKLTSPQLYQARKFSNLPSLHVTATASYLFFEALGFTFLRAAALPETTPT